jgi:hypothetical protein
MFSWRNPYRGIEMKTATKATVGAVVSAFVLAAAGAHAAELLTNGSFEAPNLGTGNYTYPGALLDSWTYDGSALVNAQGSSAWYGSTPPAGQDGDQFAALQGTSTLSQTFVVGATTDATLSWIEAGRPNFGAYAGDQTYEVLLDGNVLGTYSTVSGQAFTPEGFSLGILSAGSHTLEFEGLVAADETSFLDAVSVTSVPEPAAWALMLAGIGGLGVALRVSRRRAVVAA